MEYNDEFDMEIKNITSHNQLIDEIKNIDKAYLLLYKKGSELSECSLNSIVEAATDSKEFKIFVADVNQVRNIHTNYSITTVPALLEFSKGEFQNVFKGCNDTAYYKSVFENALYAAKAKADGKTMKSVTVYTTPTCSWCNTLKSYLRKNKIRFREVDVSKNEEQAKAMVSKSGQQGVPQTEINGQMIVGFDKKKINELLEIQ